MVGLVSASDSVLAFVPGLLLIGLGVGVMLTPSVNLVQSAFPEEQQGEISGLSRSVSNLGSSLGTAIAGTILVSDLAAGTRSYALAMVSLAVIGLIGLVAALLLPSNPVPQQLDTGARTKPAQIAAPWRGDIEPRQKSETAPQDEQCRRTTCRNGF